MGHCKCLIQQISCACDSCDKCFDNPWYPGVYHVKQPRYQSVVDCTYLPLFGTFRNWNNIQFTNENTPNEDYN